HVVKNIDGALNLTGRFRQGLALFARKQPAQLLLALGHDLRRLGDHASAHGGRSSTPLWKCGLSSRDGLASFVARGERYSTDDVIVIGGLTAFVPARAFRFGPLASNEVLGLRGLHSVFCEGCHNRSPRTFCDRG